MLNTPIPQSLWETYVELRDRLEALDRLPKSSRTDGEACDLIRKLRDIEDLYDASDLDSRYDDPDKAESKERQIKSYMQSYEKKFASVKR
jgi:hypothetical protein